MQVITIEESWEEPEPMIIDASVAFSKAEKACTKLQRRMVDKPKSEVAMLRDTLAALLMIQENLHIVRRRLVGNPGRECQIQPLGAIELAIKTADDATIFYTKQKRRLQRGLKLRRYLHWKIEAMAAWVKMDMGRAKSANLSPVRWYEGVPNSINKYR